jgi:hypothetical protein
MSTIVVYNTCNGKAYSSGVEYGSIDAALRAPCHMDKTITANICIEKYATGIGLP